MIEISNLDEKVKILVKTGIGYNVPFVFDQGTTMNAILLRRHINDMLYNQISQIRREAYEAGWKEARSKKVRKRDWFNGNINSTSI